MTNKIFCKTERFTKSNEQCWGRGRHIFASHFRLGRASHCSKAILVQLPSPESSHPWPIRHFRVHCRPENTLDSMSFGWFLLPSFHGTRTESESPNAIGRERQDRRAGAREPKDRYIRACRYGSSRQQAMAHVQRVKPVAQLVLHDCVWGWCKGCCLLNFFETTLRVG